VKFESEARTLLRLVVSRVRHVSDTDTTQTLIIMSFSKIIIGIDVSVSVSVSVSCPVSMYVSVLHYANQATAIEMSNKMFNIYCKIQIKISIFPFEPFIILTCNPN
jgi:hypothetical protein